MQVGTYFRELDDPRTEGFTIIDETDSDVRIAERYTPRDRDEPRWSTYHRPKEELRQMAADGSCEEVGRVSLDQFTRLVQHALDL